MPQRTPASSSYPPAAQPRTELHLVRQLTRQPDGANHGDDAYAQIVADCEARHDTAERNWISAVATRAKVAAAARAGDERAALHLPSVETLVVAAAERHEAALDRLSSAHMLRRAYIDSLTGALSRGIGEEQLRHDITRAHNDDSPLTVVFVDVNGLKSVNDTLGHRAGDDVLRRVGAALRASLRPYDTLVRVGGDEFVCALPSMDVQECIGRFASIEQELLRHDPPVGITCGFAQLRPGDGLVEVCGRADADLYQRRADRGGRGR